MRKMYTDANGAKWFKGNLHTHTTRTDGVKTPEEAIALYRGAGYDFFGIDRSLGSFRNGGGRKFPAAFGLRI